MEVEALMEYKLCDNPWNQEEIDAIQDVIESDMFTMGPRVRAYEALFAEKVGAQHAVMVNSGSTANLLAIAALVYSGKLKRGSEVIVPAVSWSTTYAPLEQYGMKLVFVDIDRNTLNMSAEALNNAITDKTRMVFCVNLLGNPNDYDAIFSLCTGRDIIVGEDNCESLGGVYKGKSLGTLGLFGTYSTFYSHHMCTMEGGVVVTDDRELYEFMLSIRAHGWTRDLPQDSAIHAKTSDPFYESFNFIVPGYNLRPLEMEGAIGIKQLEKIDDMIVQRRRNAAYFKKRMSAFPDIRIQEEIGESSWFGFSMVLGGKLQGKRNAIVKALKDADIECRPIVAGNFTRNKVVEYFDYRVSGSLNNADEVHFNGLFVGNHSKDNSLEIDYLVQVLARAIDEAAK